MGVLQRLERITQRRDGKIAVRDVSLDVLEGEILSIIGPNGAGKTTLLRIMALLDEPVDGRIFYKGMEVKKSNARELRSKISMIFQRTVLFDTTVRENVAYGLKLRGYRKGDIERRVEQVLELVGLKGFSERQARRLSGGEQQRVALTMALAFEPELLLLDEPTANLDPASAIMIEDIIKSIKKGTTIVLATHNLFQARRLSDRVACLLDGTLIYEGPTEDAFERPRDERLRMFVSGKFF